MDATALKTSAVQPLLVGDNSESPNKTGWLKITAIIVTNFLGTGLLSLPKATADLGWVGGYLTLAACTAGAFFSGNIFAKIREADTTVKVYADVGRIAFGDRGSKLVRTLAYVYMTGVVVAFHLTCTIALYNVAGEKAGGVCVYSWSAIIAISMILIAQVRDLNEVGWISIVGAIAIIVPSILVCITLASDGVAEGRNSPTYSESPIILQGVGAMDMVFAYAGQVIFIELMAEMEQPKDFVKAMSCATTTMAITYAVVMAFGMYYLGDQAESPITNSFVSGSPEMRIINAILLVHVLGAYAIEVNVLTRAMLNMFAKEHVYTTDLKSRLYWAGVSISFVLFAFFVSNSVPFFSDIMGFLGASLSMSLTYTLPCLIALQLDAQQYLALGPWWRRACQVMVPASVIVAILGTICSVADIISNFQVTKPFTCFG